MKLSPRRAEVVSLVAFVLHIFFFLLALLAGFEVSSVAVGIEGWHFLGGASIWLILLLQFRQRRLAHEEQLDTEQYQRLRTEGRDTSVFEREMVDGTLHLAQRRLAGLEKYFIPIFSVITSAYLIGVGTWQAVSLPRRGLSGLEGQDRLLAAAAFLVGFSLISFLFSRFAVGLSRQAEWRPLRAGGSYLLGNALACLALAVVLVIGNPTAERISAYVLVCLMIGIGIEIILNLLLDVYRPRIKGRYRRAAYESRLLGLFSEPGGLLHTAAHAIDYQFGFNVSETWFYQLMQRWILPIFGMQVAVVYLMTSIAIVQTGHQGVIERWGSPQNIDVPLESGLHFKLPWPIDRMRSFPVEQVQMLDIGFVREEHGESAAEEKPILWTEAHWHEEFPFMVAVSELASQTQAGDDASDGQGSINDFDLLVVGMTLHYRIGNVAEYGYGQDQCYLNPRKLLEDISYRQALHFAAQHDQDTLLGPGRMGTTQALHQAIQDEVDAKGMGFDILFVGLEAVHPPVDVAATYEKKVAALQVQKAMVLEAMGDYTRTLAQAQAESEVVKGRAEARAYERIELAKASAERFTQQLKAYEAGKDIYLWREYLAVLDGLLPGMRKYIFTTWDVGQWEFDMDFSEQTGTGLFETLNLPKPGQESAQ